MANKTLGTRQKMVFRPPRIHPGRAADLPPAARKAAPPVRERRAPQPAGSDFAPEPEAQKPAHDADG